VRSSLPPRTAPRRAPRKRRRLRLLKILLALVVAAVVLNVALGPWIFHMGGRFTPTTIWNGYGTVQASNGGRYVLSTHLIGFSVQDEIHGGCDTFGGCDNLRGSAMLCTEGGATYNFALSGQVHTWWSTTGARTSVALSGGSARTGALPFDVVFSGIWRGPALGVATTDNSFTEAFTPGGQIRSTTSTADAGTARVTLRYGSAAAFARACRALTGRPSL
jgi:hypothetical protein